jgi:hypothetical protein
MKTLTTFGKNFFTLALFAGAMCQPSLATSAAPHHHYIHQDPFDLFFDFADDQTMLNALASAQQQTATQPSLATSAAPHQHYIHQDPFEPLPLDFADDQTMLNASASAQQQTATQLTMEDHTERDTMEDYIEMEGRAEPDVRAEVDNKDAKSGFWYLNQPDGDANYELDTKLFGKDLKVFSAENNPYSNGTSSTKICKPSDFKTYERCEAYGSYGCPAPQCSERCSSRDNLLLHILSTHCRQAEMPKTTTTTIRAGDLICNCIGRNPRDQICKICRGTEHYKEWSELGIQQPQQRDEKNCFLDGFFRCKSCGLNVSKYTCEQHMATDCPILNAPKSMGIPIATEESKEAKESKEANHSQPQHNPNATPSAFICQACHRDYAIIDSLKTHILQKHCSMYAPTSMYQRNKQFSCNSCGALVTRSNCLDHIAHTCPKLNKTTEEENDEKDEKDEKKQ